MDKKKINHLTKYICKHLTKREGCAHDKRRESTSYPTKRNTGMVPPKLLPIITVRKRRKNEVEMRREEKARDSSCYKHNNIFVTYFSLQR